MKLLKASTILILCVVIFSCSRHTALDKDWTDPIVKEELKQQIKTDETFREYLDAQKKILTKAFLKRGVDFSNYDSTAFLTASNSGKGLNESVVAAGSKVDTEYVVLQEKSKTALFNLIKKYPGVRYFNAKDWQDMTSEELNKNFEKNIAPYLSEVYKPTN
jgi:hypothetical protein